MNGITMTSDQREALRQDVVRWIGSKDFDGYMQGLHLDPMQMPLALLASVFNVGGSRPGSVIRGVKELGLATPLMRRRYLNLVRKGAVSRGYICKSQPKPVGGNKDFTTAYIIASIGGSADDDELVKSCLEMRDELRLKAGDKTFPPDFSGSSDRVLGAGKSAFDFDEPGSIYVFSALLRESTTIPTRGRPFVLCIVNPNVWPAILPIPLAIAKPYLPTPDDEKPIKSEQPDWLKRDYPDWQQATHDFLDKRIKRERRAFYDSLSLVERMEMLVSINPALKTVELDAVIFARTGQIDNLARCLAKGVSPDLQGLMKLAITSGNAKVVELLLARGANPNKPVDGVGHTYLHEAVLYNQTAIVELLLAKGADPNQKTKKGINPLSYVRERSHERVAIIQLLEPVTHQNQEGISYQIDEFLKMENPEKAYYALCAAIQKETDREVSPAELRVLSLSSFMGFCWPNGFTDMYWQATWAVVPCAELMEGIDEPIFAGMLRQCIAIVTEYGQKIGRDPFKDDDGSLELDEEAEDKLNAPGLAFYKHDYENEALCRKTMEYLRKNRALFTESNGGKKACKMRLTN